MKARAAATIACLRASSGRSRVMAPAARRRRRRPRPHRRSRQSLPGRCGKPRKFEALANFRSAGGEGLVAAGVEPHRRCPEHGASPAAGSSDDQRLSGLGDAQRDACAAAGIGPSVTVSSPSREPARRRSRPTAVDGQRPVGCADGDRAGRLDSPAWREQSRSGGRRARRRSCGAACGPRLASSAWPSRCSSATKRPSLRVILPTVAVLSSAKCVPASRQLTSQRLDARRRRSGPAAMSSARMSSEDSAPSTSAASPARPSVCLASLADKSRARLETRCRRPSPAAS